ncbi:hypothetical protein V6N11_080613 [Hibiscus sabdariffa]|uniref:Uncharacterized protein n=1 Tax=Hibiscus sabdariffa TaxID=183260 RepID=A0ABR2R8N0_9ROSI
MRSNDNLYALFAGLRLYTTVFGINDDPWAAWPAWGPMCTKAAALVMVYAILLLPFMACHRYLCDYVLFRAPRGLSQCSACSCTIDALFLAYCDEWLLPPIEFTRSGSLLLARMLANGKSCLACSPVCRVLHAAYSLAVFTCGNPRPTIAVVSPLEPLVMAEPTKDPTLRFGCWAGPTIIFSSTPTPNWLRTITATLLAALYLFLLYKSRDCFPTLHHSVLPFTLHSYSRVQRSPPLFTMAYALLAQLGDLCFTVEEQDVVVEASESMAVPAKDFACSLVDKVIS